ncbi:hypothetical protein CBF31_06055 [Vagococcus fessus]|uniref:Cell envelope-related transcriptional attenuator domain-containing protein n=2 Tax=Vagococcus fessus TaxID=120370 RepID=A0A430A850_9ENTE|nr:hypothetical protein CBF31_06055 [Vagococcus fessus]
MTQMTDKNKIKESSETKQVNTKQPDETVKDDAIKKDTSKEEVEKIKPGKTEDLRTILLEDDLVDGAIFDEMREKLEVATGESEPDVDDTDAILEEAIKDYQLKGVKRKEITKATTLEKRKKRNRILIIGFLVLLLGIIAYSANVFTTVNGFLNDSYKPLNRNTTINDNIDPLKDPISILVLGIDNNDERNLEATRTDAMLLVTVSPKNGKISQVSIPRDTYTQINSEKYTGKGKINAAYAYGDIEATVDAVENLMNVPINHYVTIDFQAFEQIIDAFDGVEVDVPYDYTEQNAKGKFKVKLKKGRHVLNGEEALAFARTRKADDDVKRGSRQQEVMQALLKKAMGLGSITKFQDVIKALRGHFWTDMTMPTMLAVAQSGLTHSYDFDSYVFSWMSYTYYGESMVGLHQDSLDYISHRMRYNLGLDEPDERDVEGFKLESNGVVALDTFPEDGMAIIDD